LNDEHDAVSFSVGDGLMYHCLWTISCCEIEKFNTCESFIAHQTEV